MSRIEQKQREKSKKIKMMKDFKEMTALEIKEQGNSHFSMKKYELAIDCYGKAICYGAWRLMEKITGVNALRHSADKKQRKNPSLATLFTNRALCYLKLKKWDLACVDCRHALELDSNLVKGYYFLGQALLEQQAYDESIRCLKKALDAAKEQKRNYGDDIAFVLRLAQKKRFQASEKKRICQEIELQAYLTKLMKEDVEKQVSSCDVSTEEEKQEQRAKIESVGERHIGGLNELFARVDQRRKEREVPDYLCGKISFELMKDPVITPSGITYDRKDIEEHLQRVGHFDPVTRSELTQAQLIPNLAMKEVINTFVNENEWVALEY